MMSLPFTISVPLSVSASLSLPLSQGLCLSGPGWSRSLCLPSSPFNSSPASSPTRWRTEWSTLPLSCRLPRKPLTVALRPTMRRVQASSLGHGLAAPGFHSDGCLETKRCDSRSHMESLQIERLSINQDRRRGRLWAASSLERCEKRDRGLGLLELGGGPAGGGELLQCDPGAVERHLPSPWALLRSPPASGRLGVARGQVCIALLLFLAVSFRQMTSGPGTSVLSTVNLG